MRQKLLAIENDNLGTAIGPFPFQQDPFRSAPSRGAPGHLKQVLESLPLYELKDARAPDGTANTA